MGAVVTVDFVLQTLMDLPADALPGEDRTEAIRELLTASACRAVEAVGEEACRAAITLIEGQLADQDEVDEILDPGALPARCPQRCRCRHGASRRRAARVR